MHQRGLPSCKASQSMASHALIALARLLARQAAGEAVVDASTPADTRNKAPINDRK
jgi:hypothetical protein